MHSTALVRGGLLAVVGSLVGGMPVDPLASGGTLVNAFPTEPVTSGVAVVHATRQARDVKSTRLVPVSDPNKSKGEGFRKIIDVALKTEEHLFFRGHGVFAQSTVQPKNKVISADRIGDDLKSLKCPSNGELAVEIASEAAYTEVKAGWAGQKFVFVANGDCGGEDGIQAFSISSSFFDDKTQTAKLKGRAESWDDDSWYEDMVYRLSSTAFDGFAKEPGVNQPANRKWWELDPVGGHLSVATDFSGKEIISYDLDNNTHASLNCKDCAVTGAWDWTLEASSKTGIKASVTAKDGLGLRIVLGLQLTGSLAEAKDLSVPILPTVGIPGGSFQFAGGDFGFDVSVLAQASLSEVVGTMEGSFGVQMNIADDSTIQIGGDEDSHVDVSFQKIDPEFSASITVTASVAPVLTLGVGGTIAKKGVSAGLAATAPRITATLEGHIESNGGLCGDPNGVASIALKVDVDAELSVYYGFGAASDLPNQKPIYTTDSFTLLDVCKPFTVIPQDGPGGPQGTGQSTPPPPPDTSCPGGVASIGGVAYDDGSSGPLCNAGNGATSIIFPSSSGSTIRRVIFNSNSQLSKCTLYKTTKSDADNNLTCEDPIGDAQPNIIFTILPMDLMLSNVCLVCD